MFIIIANMRHFIVVLLMVVAVVMAAKKDAGPVTCGSVIKMNHKATGNNLHSHAIAWGSGSGQQSVTTNKVKSDKGSMWVVKEAHEVPMCEVGAAIKCGDYIRLEHADTKKNLHSHLFRAPLSGNQEVSGFGDGGNGDTGDNWQIVCEGNEIYWQRGKVVSFMHVDTKKYLSSSETFKFNHQNCGGGCPILDQTEVSASSKKDANAKWNTDQGVYFPSKTSNMDEDDEL